MTRSLFGLRPATLVRFYAERLRAQPVQEALAGAGIAIGVALVFAVQVANTSITGSAEGVVHGIFGSARVQVLARGPAGMDARLVGNASRLPGVRVAAPMLQRRVAVLGPRGRRTVELVGATPRIAELGGALTRDFGPGGLRLARGVTLPRSVADAVGAQPGGTVTLLADGQEHRLAVGAVVGSAVIGSLADSPVAIAPLGFAQQLVAMRGRVTRILVEPRPGSDAAVRRRLLALAGPGVTVGSPDAELRLLHQAAGPNDQSTTLFAAISAMVGVLLAFNAMALSVPARRRFIADLRMEGFEPRQVVAVLAFQALALGLVASVLGIVLGEVLLRLLFGTVPGYLTFAFAVGGQRVVRWSTVAIAVGGGIAAAVVASARPMLDVYSRRPVDAVLRDDGDRGEGVSRRSTTWLLGAAVALVAGTTVLAVVAPAATIAGVAGLALVTILVMPAMFAVALRLAWTALAGTGSGGVLAVSLLSLRDTATRSMVLACVGGIAVFGCVAIDGARHDLLRGLDRNFAEYVSTADLWVTTGGNDLTTESFSASAAVRDVRNLPEVASVREYRGGLLDVDGRRAWVIARPADEREMLPPSELRIGDLGLATGRLRASGWAVLSEALAKARGLRVGDPFLIPTPSGATRFRLAAVTTNLGWGPGVVIMNAADFAHAWRSPDPTALEIDLAPGIAPAAGRRAVQRAVGSGLRVQTRAEREAQYQRLGRQGLDRLRQISTLLLIAASLAMAMAMGAAVWQQRRAFAALKVAGFGEWQLWRSLLYQAAFVLTLGCGVGAGLGLYGHYLLTRWLAITTGFPAPFSLAAPQATIALAVVAGAAVVITALPGYAVAQVAPSQALQE